MNRDEKIIKLKLDVIFKRIFGDERNQNIIAAFVSAMLEIPRESIRAIYIHNTELTPEYFDQKFSRLDLKLDVDGRLVNVEMQVSADPDYRDRTLFYWARMFSGELQTGEEYGMLKQTFCINIINFNLFDCLDYHSHFKVMERDRHEVLSDKFAIHFFELKKLGQVIRHTPMEDWLRLIDAETEGDLMDIQNTTTIPEVQETIVMLRELNADEKAREEALRREMMLHDRASALGHARREGLAEGRAEERAALAAKARAMGLTEEQLQQLFGV